MSERETPHRWFAWAGPNAEACWEWRGARTNGYAKLHDGSNRRAARAIWEALYGPIGPGLIVMHRCDNPACVRPNHLELGTHGQNQQDKWTRGRGVIGRPHASTRRKISREDADEIRRLYGTRTLFQREIGERYGLTQHAVSKIVRNKTYVL